MTKKVTEYLTIRYSVEVNDFMRAAINEYYGRDGIATDDDVRDWYKRFGYSQDDDLFVAENVG